MPDYTSHEQAALRPARRARSARYSPRVCEHGNASSCPEDRLCQIRLRGSGRYGEEWQTHTVVACDSRVAESWCRQVAPLKRRQGYETRVVRVGDV